MIWFEVWKPLFFFKARKPAINYWINSVHPKSLSCGCGHSNWMREMRINMKKKKKKTKCETQDTPISSLRRPEKKKPNLRTHWAFIRINSKNWDFRTAYLRFVFHALCHFHGICICFISVLSSHCASLGPSLSLSHFRHIYGLPWKMAISVDQERGAVRHSFIVHAVLVQQ